MTDDPTRDGRTPEPDQTPDPDGPQAEQGLFVESDELDLDLDSESDGSAESAPSEEPAPSAEPAAPAEEEPLDEAAAPAATDDIVVPAAAFPDDEPDDEPTGQTYAAPPAAPTHPHDQHDDDDEEPAEVAKKPKRRWGRKVLLGVLVLVGAAYVAGYFLTGTRLPANTSIGGIDVSGKSPDDAVVALETALEPRAGKTIELTHGKKTFQVKPKKIALVLDAERSVAQAGAERSWDPRDMLALVRGENSSDLAFDVDEAELQSAIATISESVDRDVVEAQITFPKGKPVAREPKAGRVVSQSDTETAILTSYLVSTEPIRVPTVAVEPTVDSDGLRAAMDSLAKPAVSGPVRLVVSDKEISLPVSAYAPALTVRTEGGPMVLHLDPKKLAKPLTDSTTGIGKKAVDATVRITNGKPEVVPGKAGVGLQPQEMATRLIPALTRSGSERAIEVEAKVVEPAFTTKDAKALKITEKIGEFTTEFPYAEYRNVNQSRGAALINGTIVKPGETFSFNDTVGERTVANGFTTGTVINGGVFREELGGGVSQVVTTMYNAAFFGGMDDVEHHPHAFYIDRYPVGREATVYYGSLDLRWKNPTEYGVLVRAYVDKSTPSSPGRTHVELWSTKVWDKVEAGKSERRNFRAPGKQYDDTPACVAQAPITGFDIDIYRTFFKDGKKVKTETDTANYQAADTVVCGKKPKPKSDD